MIEMNTADRNAAPDDLELVRRLLNTWRIPHDTRAPSDDLQQLVESSENEWKRQFETLPRPTDGEQVSRLTQIRDGLRDMVQRNKPNDNDLWWFHKRLSEYPVVPIVAIADAGMVVDLRPQSEETSAALLTIVLRSMQRGTWNRLKACPDCRLSFYDRSPGATKVWCGMTTNGPQGRACGSIAKMRTYRKRKSENLN